MRLFQRAPSSAATAVALAAAIVAAGAVGLPQAQASTSRGHRAVTEKIAREAGLQIGPKHTTRPQVKVGSARYAAPNRTSPRYGWHPRRLVLLAQPGAGNLPEATEHRRAGAGAGAAFERRPDPALLRRAGGLRPAGPQRLAAQR